MADTGMAYTLIEGTGKIYGLVIVKIWMRQNLLLSLKMVQHVKPITLTLKIVKE